MRTKLLQDQAEDVEKIAQAVDLPNFSEAGSGKTFTTIGAVERMGFNNGIIVGPPSAMIMWQETLEYELDGCKAQWLKRKDTEIDPLADFYVLTYNVVGDHYKSLMRGNYGFMACDESHRLRTPYSVRGQAILGPRCDGEDGLYEACQQTWMLTGTPIERYADDLWMQLRATQPDVLWKHGVSSLYKFQRMFCRMEDKAYHRNMRPKTVSVDNINEQLLNSILYDEIKALRRTVSQDLPPVRFRDVTVGCPLSGDLKRYMAGKTLEQIEEELLQGGSEITHTRRLIGLGKIKDSVDYIHGVAKKQPVLVGYWHTEVGKELTKRLQDKRLEAHRIGGDVASGRRERIRKAFNAGEVDVIVGQMGAMRESMNLQEYGRYIIVAEDDWSAATIEQFYKRIARRGQENAVQVDFLRCDYPVDTALRKVRERKMTGSEAILTN